MFSLQQPHLALMTSDDSVNLRLQAQYAHGAHLLQHHVQAVDRVLQLLGNTIYLRGGRCVHHHDPCVDLGVPGGIDLRGRLLSNIGQDGFVLRVLCTVTAIVVAGVAVLSIGSLSAAFPLRGKGMIAL